MSQTVQQATTQDAVARYLEGLNSLDPERALSRYAPDAVIRYPGRAPMSLEDFRAHLQRLGSALSSLEFATHEVFETEHGVAARWTFTATTSGGRTARCDGIDSWRIGDDGTITSVDVYYDPSPVVEALAD